MNDPYMPLEREVNLTGRALEVIAQFGFPVHVMTKSDLVLRDLTRLREIGKVYAAVSFTITTADDDLGRKLEPGAPMVSERFRAMERLAAAGVLTGVVLMPVLPFLEDSRENIRRIVVRAGACGAAYVIPAFGMTLRDRQRAYYYQKLDELFPGLRAKYEARYGDDYECPARNAARLGDLCGQLCRQRGIALRIPQYGVDPPRQLGLF
jgi:DNA repair photolyase